MHGTTVALGLGSNLGNSLEYLRSALSAIKQIRNLTVKNVSSIYESDALTPEKAPAEWNKKYLNAVVLVTIEGEAEPLSLLKSLKEIEVSLGRKTGEVWAPRELDIDILYWSRGNFVSEAIAIPHKRLFERPFALLPLLEVWPQLRKEIENPLPTWVDPWVATKPFNTKTGGHLWPRLVGILNVTPDSFSDGGQWMNREAVERQLQYFAEQKVDIVDVGAESTRPNAVFVSPEEELNRLKWAFQILKQQHIKISLDCRRGEVAEKILNEFEVEYLNDVSGMETEAMQKVLKTSGKKAFVMHSLGVPPSKEKVLPSDQDPCEQLANWWKLKCGQLESSGIKKDRLVFDPGIGFGKTPEQSFYILNNLDRLHGIKSEMMIGHSRKSFLNLITDKPASERDTETALVTQQLNLAFVQYLRIHDPKSQRFALQARSQMC